MASKTKFDFGGFATKSGIRCADGRVILKDAFAHMDGEKVPLVWQHIHDSPDNILGHAVLETREEGIYARCKFNESPAAQNAKEAVKHGDITSLSIFANKLKQKGSSVVHGVIREVSLVLTGANPGAHIDDLTIVHGYGTDSASDEDEAAIIYTGLGFHDESESMEHMTDAEGIQLLNNELEGLSDEQRKRLRDRTQYMVDDRQMDLIFTIINAMTDAQRLELYKMVNENVVTVQHGEDADEALMHAAKNKHADDATLREVFDTLDETQKTVVYAMLASAVAEGEVKHSENEGESDMKVNVFDESTKKSGPSLTHDQMSAIMVEAKDTKAGSLKEVFLAHAADYGVENIEVLFPDAQVVRPTPDLIKRDDDWVSGFLSLVYKTPFSRIKSRSADLTADEARAKGYITGNRKIEEVIPVLRRVTTPTTIN